MILDPKKDLSHIFDFNKLKYCYECGICTATCPVADLLPEDYNPRTLLHSLPNANEKLLNSANLWLCAWCGRCYSRCPQKINLPEIFQNLRRFAFEHGYTKGFYKALRIIRENIPLPASCCYVCFHPNRVIGNDKIVDEAIKDVVLDYEANRKNFPPVTKYKQGNVVIIGSGPAGLSAAHVLANKGYSITVLEGCSLSGGMLKRCIPEYRLPKKIVNFEVNCIKKLGVKIQKNQKVDDEPKMEKLFQDYDAVFVATGATKERALDLEGEDLDNIFYALDFLEKTNLKEIEVSDKVLVIGGGDVAIDCARSALRLGSKQVSVLYRRSREEMPANLWEVNEAEKEGVKIEFLVTPTKFIGKDGRVVGIECVKNKLGQNDESGRKQPVAIDGSKFKIEVDYVVIAVGQFPNTAFLQKKVDITEDHKVAVNPFTMETSSPRVFAGGDATSGPGTVMEAILAGKQAANTIDCYLQSLSMKLSKVIKK
jgi:NADPH-dependent glutamate synthase beta subunit-like oxidoreductase